ncbi:Protoglobin-domain-containing protein [Chytriomyces sp. MP71]|nr:Protoglobin-domain-containing protein [Chytriomyces sp. MP71]
MTPKGKITQVDRDKLYTDLTYRFKYVSQFVGFDETDIAAIKGAAPLIAPLVPTIVDAVYEHLFSFDITKVSMATMLPLTELTTEDDQIKFRKDFLGKYLVKLVTAEYDAAFVSYLDRVGRIHTNTPGKKSRINVEYIHCNALFGWLHGFLAETIDKLPELQDVPEVRAKTLGAFSKLLWIQNDFFSMYYLRESETFKGHHTVQAPNHLDGIALLTFLLVVCLSAMIAVYKLNE